MSKPRAAKPKGNCHNRIRAIMAHTTRYGCFPTARLARDTGIAKSTISHLLHGRTEPLLRTATAILRCLEVAVDRPLDLREVFSEDGSYPTKSVCQLVGCPGCLPEGAFDADHGLRSEFLDVAAGQWSGDTAEFAIEERAR